MVAEPIVREMSERSSLPSLGIIIVNYCSGDLLRQCVASIRKETRASFRLWIVDNASDDGSAENLEGEDVRVLRNRVNVGFSRATNQALEASTEENLLLVNPDTVIRTQAIDALLKYLTAKPQVGIAGCRVLNEDGTLQAACRRNIPTARMAFFRLSGISRIAPGRFDGDRYNLDDLDPGVETEVGAVSGSFMLIRREVFRRIGLFDERFFLYGEDLDVCYRASQAGWKIMYFPGAEVVHLKGRSALRNRNRSHYEFYRAMYVFHRKHFARTSPLWLNLLVVLGIVGRGVITWPARWLRPSSY